MGWTHWPDNEDLSTELMRLLGAAQEGGSTVSECFLTANRIHPNDEQSWFQEWKKTGDVSAERADRAIARGNLLTAQSNWLRATNYYNAAMFPFDCADKRRHTVLASMRACARSYLKHRKPAGAAVEIPWLEGYPLEGYSCQLRTRHRKRRSSFASANQAIARKSISTRLRGTRPIAAWPCSR